MTAKQELKYYFLTWLILTIAGVILSVIVSIVNSDNHILILMLVGALIMTTCSTILNLMYFLPNRLNQIKFMIPGILMIFILAYIYRNDLIELMVAEFYGVTNLILGLIWTYKSKMKNTNTNIN